MVFYVSGALSVSNAEPAKYLAFLALEKLSLSAITNDHPSVIKFEASVREKPHWDCIF